MANSITHAALPYCICGARFSLVLGFETAAGVPTDPTSSDTEYSVDGGASFADCAEEITTGGSAGVGYLTLTGAETNNSVLAIRSRSGNCDDATRVIPIMALASVGTGTLSAGSAGGGTLGTILAYDVTGCFVKTTGGTGGGGTGGANNQARKIATYNTSTGAFTVSPNWETTPDNTTTYAVLLPEGVTLGMLQTINPATPGRKPVVDADGLVDANTVKVGPTGSGTAQTAGDIPALINTVDDFLDTEIAAIKAKTDNLPTDPADQSAVESAITAATSPLATAGNLAVVAGYIDTEIAAIINAIAAIPTADQNATQLLDVAAGVETNRTVRQALRIILASAAGKLSGAATTTIAIRDTNDNKDRISATVDADGNRLAVTLDAT